MVPYGHGNCGIYRGLGKQWKIWKSWTVMQFIIVSFLSAFLVVNHDYNINNKFCQNTSLTIWIHLDPKQLNICSKM